MKRTIRVLALLLLGGGVGAAVGCGDSKSGPDLSREKMTDGGSFFVSYAPDPDPIPLEQEFEVRVSVFESDRSTPAADVTLAFDAWMPDHGHGMPAPATVGTNVNGIFLVSGMYIPMDGMWDFYADVTRAGTTERATFLHKAGTGEHGH